MEIFHNLIFGFSVAFSLQNLFYCFLGCLLGTLIGVLPGIGPLATIAMLMPITFTVPPVAALIMLAGIYYGAQYGGSTTSILVNLPGETSSVVTCIDGYQMARQGRAGAALAIAAIGSFFAGTVCTLLIALFGPPIAEIALKFGFAGVFFADADGPGHGGGARPRRHGQVARDGGAGSAARQCGDRCRFRREALHLRHHRVGGRHRFRGHRRRGVRLGRNHLQPRRSGGARRLHLQGNETLFPTKEDLKRSIGPIIRGTLLGAFFGVLPGTGPAIASFSSYMIEKKVSQGPVALRPRRDRGGGGTRVGQ